MGQSGAPAPTMMMSYRIFSINQDELTDQFINPVQVSLIEIKIVIPLLIAKLQAPNHMRKQLTSK